MALRSDKPASCGFFYMEYQRGGLIEEYIGPV